MAASAAGWVSGVAAAGASRAVPGAPVGSAGGPHLHGYKALYGLAYARALAPPLGDANIVQLIVRRLVLLTLPL
jgi:hypothetical protein